MTCIRCREVSESYSSADSYVYSFVQSTNLSGEVRLFCNWDKRLNSTNLMIGDGAGTDCRACIVRRLLLMTTKGKTGFHVTFTATGNTQTDNSETLSLILVKDKQLQ